MSLSLEAAPTKRDVALTRWMTRAVIAITCFAAALLGTWAAITFFSTDSKDVFAFELQSIEAVADDGTLTIPRVDGYDQPSVTVHESVPVRGSRCTLEPYGGGIDVTANVWWERLEPAPGLFVHDLVDFDTTVENGDCITLEFLNPMPPQVSAHIIADNNQVERWRITGSVEPLLADTNTALFETESFLIINDHDPVVTEPSG